MADYELLPRSPAGVKPHFFYFNESGTFELDGDEGVSVYAWPPTYTHGGSRQSNALSSSFHNRLIFHRWDVMQLPGGKQDFGWIYKTENEDFYIFFSSEAHFYTPNQNYPPFTVYRLYYSADGQLFNRWRTDSGTRRLALHDRKVEQISTPPGDISEVPGSTTPSSEMRFGLGTHKLPNEYRACPANVFAGEKNHGIDSRSFSLKIWVDVEHASVQQMKSQISECLRESTYASAIAALIAAYYTGGNPAAMWGAFEVTFAATFPTCVKSKTNNWINFTLKQEEIRGAWSGH